MKNRNMKRLFDRIDALMHTTEMTMWGNIETTQNGNIRVKPDLITISALEQITKEFENLVLDEQGLIIFK